MRILERRPEPEPKQGRGPEVQEEKRELERTMRRRGVTFARWTGLAGKDVAESAGRLGLSERTLRAWKSGWEKDRLRSKPVGRRAMIANSFEREAILAILGVAGPGASACDLQAIFPRMARRELAAILEGYRDDWTRRNERVVMALRWKRVGRVWAMDFTEPPLPVEGRYPYILVIRDLASGYVLLALPCMDATQETTKQALEAVLKQTDAPLVLKTDNGSHFAGGEIREFVAKQGIVQLFSPPGTPRYNGAVEAGIGSIKTRAHFEAARHDRPGEWTCDDVEKARCLANDYGRPRGFEGASPAQMWHERERVYDNERSDFRGKVRELEAQARSERGYFPILELAKHDQDNLDRVSISRACVALGYLSYRRRRIPISISDLKRRKIS